MLKDFMNGLKVKIGEIEVGLDIDPEKGSADSGDLDSDLPSLFVAVPLFPPGVGLPMLESSVRLSHYASTRARGDTDCDRAAGHKLLPCPF